MVHIRVGVDYEFDQTMLDVEFQPEFNVEFDAEEVFTSPEYGTVRLHGYYIDSNKWARVISKELVK